MKLLKKAFRFAIWTFGLAAIVFIGLFLASSGAKEVRATVVNDANLPMIEIGGIKLHAESHGDASTPAIIVLHGGPGADYSSLLPLTALSDKYQVVFYDQRGAGLSERVGAEALRQFCWNQGI